MCAYSLKYAGGAHILTAHSSFINTSLYVWFFLCAHLVYIWPLVHEIGHIISSLDTEAPGAAGVWLIE